MQRRLIVLLMLTASLAGAKKSPSPKPPPVPAVPTPKPPPESQQLRFFEGDWHCDGKALDANVQTHWVFKAEANKFWVSAHRSDKNKNRPGFVPEMQGYWGYDAVGHQYVRVMMGNQGDWEQATSPGWTGEDWVWTGEINQADGHKLPLRHSITSNGPREFSDKLELNVDGEWRVAASSTVCKK